MKGSQLILLFTLLFASSFLPAQTDIPVPEKQVPLVSKISASWCPFCGTWGWDLMEGIMEDNAGVSSIISVHYSGSYRTDAGAKMTTNFGAVGQPQFFLNSDLISVSSSSAQSKRAEIKTAIEQNAAKSPVAQSGIKVGTHEGQLNILTNTKFFQQAEGEYYLGLYLLEQEFLGPQAGRTDNSLHKNLLRMNFMDNAFGELLVQGPIAADTEMFVQKSISLNDVSYSMNNISVLSIIWKKQGDRYLVVNTNQSSEIIAGLELMTTGLQPLAEADFHVQLSPNVVDQTARLQLELPSARAQFEIALWQLNGQKVQTIFQGPLGSGRHEWEINRADLASGIYVLQLHDGRRQWSERIVFR